MTIKHAFVSPKSDEEDETLVRPIDWNAEHELRVALNKLLLGAGPGAEPTEVDPYAHPGTPQCSGCPHPSGRYSHPGSPVCSGCPHPSGRYTHPTSGSCPQTPKSHNAASHSDIASSGASIDDAVAKKHTQGTDAAFTAISQTEPARSIGTQYQNTSGKIRIVTVGALASGGSRNLMVYVKSSSPADDEMGRQDILENKEGMVTFIVPPNYYYKVDGTATKQEWHEWDLH